MMSFLKSLLPLVALILALALGQSEVKGANILTPNTPIMTAGGCFVGTSCVNQNFYGSTNTSTGINQVSIYLGAIQRFVGPVAPSPLSSNNYVVPTGSSGGTALWTIPISYTVPTNFLSYILVLAVSDLNLPGTIVNPLIFSPSFFPNNEYRTAGGVETTGTFLANAGTAVTLQ